MDPLLLLAIGMLIVLGGILGLRLPAFLALILGALVVGLFTTDEALTRYALSQDLNEEAIQALTTQSVGKRLALGFGATCGKIGILIAMATIIGTSLLKSGAADRIIRAAISLFGEKRMPLAFLSSGFTLGIPVFVDTVFYLMLPLARSVGIRHPSKYGLYIMTVIAGTSMAHSLIPPTPGPLFVAGELNINLGTMMLAGIIVGLFTATAGYFYARWANGRWDFPLRPTAESSLEEMQAMAQRKTESLPSLSLSLLPILLPIVLIAGNTFYRAWWLDANSPYFWTRPLAFLGDPNLALIISAGFAILVLVRQLKDRKQVTAALQDALSNAGVIILIIGAGGAFGAILQQTGVGVRILELTEVYQFAVLPMAFLLTTAIRTAQGSATVAMITTVGILAGIADATYLGFHPVYLALAIGCGSKPFPWMNDSGFWIIGKLSGFNEVETIRSMSFLLSFMALVGLAVIMIGAWLFPLV